MSRRSGDIDDLEVLETYGWNEDPWDNSLGVGEVEQLRTQTRAARWVVFGAMVLSIALILGGGLYGWWYIRQANPAGEAGAVVPFTVVEGDTLRSVSDRLEAEGIITNAGFFRSYANDNGGLDAIEPGLYLLRPGDHVGNILSRLRTSPSETTTRITFPEGFTLQQMANRLEANENLPQFSAAAFMEQANDPTIVSAFRPAGVTSMEGLLFPATYEVSNADSERQVIERMAQNMEYVGDQLGITSPDVAGFTPYEILIIASMIEREAKTEVDRPLIARVIYNRLALGMRLEIDATAIYGAPPEMKPPAVEPDDMDIDAMVALNTPWNTYFLPRLPPTPIANPGRASIEAALHPAPDVSDGSPLCAGLGAEQCRYLYYVVKDQQGNHVFAVTAEQHAANVEAARAAGLLD
jgi:UPF0755 protein